MFIKTEKQEGSIMKRYKSTRTNSFLSPQMSVRGGEFH